MHETAAMVGPARKLVVVLVLSLGCTGDAPSSDDAPDGSLPPSDGGGNPIVTDPLHDLPTGQEAWTALCAKNHPDTVSEAFCDNGMPALTGFQDLRNLLGLGGDLGMGIVMATGAFHSTAVSGRFVTPLNPRMFLMTPTSAPINPTTPQPMPTYNIIAFSRGELFVELASKDTVTKQPRFFLLRFELACESAASGCNLADLLTPTTESGWVGWSIYDEEALANTTVDCLRCHQPDGPGTTSFLRMQELRNPWNHWFYPETADNIAAIMAFEEAHVGELYAGLPASVYRGTRPVNLQRLIQNNGPLNQPNEYNSNTINAELMASGSSATWNAMFAEVVAGREIPVPVPNNPQTDPAKLALMKQAYLDVVNGDLARDQMPDIRDVFTSSALDAISYRPKAGLDGQAIVTQICSQCHNSRLDQSLSRAQFNAETLSQLSRTEKDRAIERLQLPDGDIYQMPPSRFYTLSDAERQLVIQELQK